MSMLSYSCTNMTDLITNKDLGNTENKQKKATGLDRDLNPGPLAP